MTNDKDSIYKNLNLYGIDIEILHIFKGLYNESNEFNYMTKLFFAQSNKDEDQCMHPNNLGSLAVNQIYFLIGNFSEGRLFLKTCDYLRRTDQMRTKDLKILRKGIDCKK